MHARVTAYRGHLVIELLAECSIPNEVVTLLDTPGNLGTVICDTARNLGISAEALSLLRTLRPGSDGLGEIDWFASGDTHTFGWMGSVKSIMDPAKVAPSRDWKIGPHLVVMNDVPQGAKDHIDKTLGGPAVDASTSLGTAAAAVGTPSVGLEIPRKGGKPFDKQALFQRICRQMELSQGEYRILAKALA
jgi:hypothetical protein